MTFLTPGRSCSAVRGVARRTIEPQVSSTDSTPIGSSAAWTRDSISSFRGQAGVVSSIVKRTARAVDDEVLDHLTGHEVTAELRLLDGGERGHDGVLGDLGHGFLGGGRISDGRSVDILDPGRPMRRRRPGGPPEVPLRGRAEHVRRSESPRSSSDGSPIGARFAGEPAWPLDHPWFDTADHAPLSSRHAPHPYDRVRARRTAAAPGRQRRSEATRARGRGPPDPGLQGLWWRCDRAPRGEVRGARRGRPHRRRRPHRPRGPRRRVLQPPRTVRLRQDDDPPDDRRLRAADLGHDRARRART